MKASNLWVYLYELCHTETTEGKFWSVSRDFKPFTYLCYSDIVPQDDLWDALIKFMEVSSVGDFELRLKMIKCFHVEMGTVESIVIAM